ncbi:Cactin [Apiospora rasikravindrae]|uniref:Splicing factor Cactin n=1 Tax=Apiospora rasikravindrae TaxID=990691 RepID=A0ABR1SMB5_9PEZI
MDPARRAMINGGGSRKSPARGDITSPRRDPNTRITKQPARPPSKPNAAYMTQDEASKKWMNDEDKFVLRQSKKKADIRVREGRAKPIDLLAFNLRWIDQERDVFDDHDGDVEMRVPAPLAVMEGLNEAQLDELEEEITSYRSLETNTRNRDYWTALGTICADRKRKIKPMGAEERAVSSVSTDVDRILGPKTLEQLEKLEGQIKAKLQSDEAIDTDYWEQLLKSLLIYKAKARLTKVYEAIRESRLKQLREQNPAKADALASSGLSTVASAQDGPATVISSSSQPAKGIPAPVGSAAKPTTTAASTSVPGTARFSATGDEDFSQATRALYEREVARGVSENEEIFTAEETVPGTDQPQWADKYRPRKPRYFNRVVQGYKFNIFYPDLIDKTKAPTFKIIREHGRRRGESFAPAGEEDTCLIRFIAGPPYEDIAFRIVDREWDYSAKRERGFRSSFDKDDPELVRESRWVALRTYYSLVSIRAAFLVVRLL